jgi:hypothetical protein
VGFPFAAMQHLGGGQLTLRTLKTFAEIEEIRKIWMTWQSHPISDFDNFLLIARSRPEIQRPHVMVVYRDGRPDCMLVGRLEYAPMNFQLGYLKVFDSKVRILCFMHGGFLGNQCAENSAFLIGEIMQALKNKEADVARLESVKTDSALSDAAKRIPGILCRDFFSPMHIHGCVQLPGSFQAFLSGLSRKERHNLKRLERRLQGDFSGRVQIRCFRQESQIEELLHDAEEVAKKTYQRGLGVGFSGCPETRETLQMAARRGTLRGCVLYLGGRPCAFLIGAQYRETLHGSFMGFDPQFCAYAPGSLLLMHWIEEAFEPNGGQRISQIDLGPGDARYKRTICNHLWNERLIFIFAPTFMGLRLNLHRILCCLLYRCAKSLAVRAGMFEKVKRLWRSRARDSETEILSKPVAV